MASDVIKAILVDDEKHGLEMLSWLLEKYPNVEVLGAYSNPKEAVKSIENLNPDIVFLDIEMPSMNGFELLQAVGHISFSVVFTTAYDEFAIKAFKVSALDYLLKPIGKEELHAAIEKHISKANDDYQNQLKLLKQLVEKPTLNLDKIAFPTFEGLEFVKAHHIIRCEADDNYTHIHLENKQPFLVSKTLKEVEELLADHGFLRVHYSHLVNLNKIKKYVKGDGGYVIMEDDSSVNVSRSKKEVFLNAFIQK